jgi:hypothetical protein
MDQLGLFMRAVYETEREAARYALPRHRADRSAWKRLVRLIRAANASSEV